MSLENLDANEEPKSSDGSTLDVADDQVTDPNAEAASSTADENSSADTLSIVRDVVSGRSEEAASSAEGEADPKDSADTDQPTEEDNENYSDVPFNKHPRFQQLLRENKSYKTDAERYRNVQNFMDNNGITAEEAADGFVIMGLMKTNPQEAWKQLRPIVQNLLIAAGEVLPEDLQQLVQSQKMTPEAALEVSRSRATVQSVKATNDFQAQRTQRTAAKQQSDAVYQAAVDWQADREKKDPNFAAKVEPLRKELAWLQRSEGVPNTPEGVKEQLERAYKAIVPARANPAPKAHQQRPGQRPQAAAQSTASPQPKPESTLDIIRQTKALRA